MSSDCIPLVTSAVQAGFSSVADEHIERHLDLNRLMIKHPAATFFVRVEGNSMQGAGIHSGDILVVDRSLEAIDGKIVIACIDGEFTVKRLQIGSQIGSQARLKTITLAAANPNYPDIKIEKGVDFSIWGVVTYVIHSCIP